MTEFEEIKTLLEIKKLLNYFGYGYTRGDLNNWSYFIETRLEHLFSSSISRNTEF